MNAGNGDARTTTYALLELANAFTVPDLLSFSVFSPYSNLLVQQGQPTGASPSYRALRYQDAVHQQSTMVKTRSNLDTADPGTLPFDADDVAVRDKVSNRSRIEWDYFSKILSHWPKPRWKSFLLSKPDFHDDAESEWLPVRPLGSGSCMVVALWKKLDRDGDAVDRVVIKQSRVGVGQNMYSVGLSNEAVYQGHLTAMKASQHNITQLRGYKFYPAQQGSVKQDHARLYLRYAPHGTLQDVWFRYRAFRTYLPELYLWSVLVDLATAYQLLGKCPETWIPIHRNGLIPQEMGKDPDAFIAHHDIKPVNCFVGTGESKTSRRSAYYPTELGDFGTAEVRRPDSSAKLFFDVGTPQYYAPEQCAYGDRWVRQIYHFSPPVFRVPKSTNAWGIGQIMFHLMTLKTLNQFPGAHLEDHRLHRYDPPNEADALYERDYYAFGGHFMPRSATDCDHPAGQYSEALRDLVYQCLRPDMVQRPEAAELVRRAQTGYQTCRRKTRKDGVPPVHFSNQAMNDHIQPPGDATFVFSRQEPVDNWIFSGYIRDGDFRDPEDSLLKPRSGWSDFGVGAPGPPLHPEPEQYLDEYPAPPNAHNVSARREVLDDLRDGRLLDRKDVDVVPGERSAPKRARSWNAQDEHDREMRQLLQDLRNRTRRYASGKSMRLLSYIIEREKYDVSAAKNVLEWLYLPRSKIRFTWAQSRRVQQQAATILRKWKERFGRSRPRNLRECLYFVSHENPGPLSIKSAIRKMEFMFQPEDADSSDGDDGDQDRQPAEPATPTQGNLTKDQLQRYREAQIALLDLYERGLYDYWGMGEAELIRRLHEFNWDVQALVDQILSAHEDQHVQRAARLQLTFLPSQQEVIVESASQQPLPQDGYDEGIGGYQNELGGAGTGVNAPPGTDQDYIPRAIEGQDGVEFIFPHQQAAGEATGQQQDGPEAITGNFEAQVVKVDPYWMTRRRGLEEENATREARLAKELDANHQQRHREEHNENMRKKPTGARQHSVDLAVGDRWDPDFGVINPRERERPPKDQIYLSGALRPPDVPGMHEDREHMRQVGIERRVNKQIEKLERKERERAEAQRKQREAEEADEDGEEAEEDGEGDEDAEENGEGYGEAEDDGEGDVVVKQEVEEQEHENEQEEQQEGNDHETGESTRTRTRGEREIVTMREQMRQIDEQIPQEEVRDANRRTLRKRK